jgi:hypothetical protein
MRLCIAKIIGFKDAPYKLGVPVEQLVEHLKVVKLCATLLLLRGRRIK